MARTVSDLSARLAALAETGENETPILVEGPDGALYPVAEVTPDDLAVVVTLADPLAAETVPTSIPRQEVEEVLASLLRSAVAENPFRNEAQADVLAPAFVSFVRGVVRMARAAMDVEGPGEGLAAAASILSETARLLGRVAEPIQVAEFAAVLAGAPSAPEPEPRP